MLEVYPANSQAQKGWRTGRQAFRQQDLIPQNHSRVRKESGKPEPFQTKASYGEIPHARYKTGSSHHVESFLPPSRLAAGLAIWSNAKAREIEAHPPPSAR
jgi:hypothetical protein